MTVERRQNHLRQSQLIFQKTFRTLRKNEEISKVLYFFSFGLKLKMKLVETVSVTIGVKFRQTSYASKTNQRQSKEFAFLLLIGDCKFFFVCGRNVSLFISFFHLKNTSDCIVASQLNENKSNNETKFVWVKNQRGRQKVSIWRTK